jgi:hypothetical protein
MCPTDTIVESNLAALSLLSSLCVSLDRGRVKDEDDAQ